jgi:predicted kinase
MDPPRVPTLYLIGGRIAAGKSTLAQRLARRPATVLISQDEWMLRLFTEDDAPAIEDDWRRAARLRDAIGPLVVDILRQGVSVVLDFPANTVRLRTWMRLLIEQANVTHELHYLEVPDSVCKERLKRRNDDPAFPFDVSEEKYDLVTSYIVPPGPEEGFNVILHKS